MLAKPFGVPFKTTKNKGQQKTHTHTPTRHRPPIAARGDGPFGAGLMPGEGEVPRAEVQALAALLQQKLYQKAPLSHRCGRNPSSFPQEGSGAIGGGWVIWGLGGGSWVKTSNNSKPLVEAPE